MPHLFPPPTLTLTSGTALSVIESVTGKMTSSSTTTIIKVKNTIHGREKFWFHGVWPLNSIGVFFVWLRMLHAIFLFFSLLDVRCRSSGLTEIPRIIQLVYSSNIISKVLSNTFSYQILIKIYMRKVGHMRPLFIHFKNGVSKYFGLI